MRDEMRDMKRDMKRPHRHGGLASYLARNQFEPAEERADGAIVLGKGEGLIAEQIKRVAEEEGIPVMQNVPLARAMMRSAEVNQYIPSEFIEPVAEVLKALKRLAEEQQQGET